MRKTTLATALALAAAPSALWAADGGVQIEGGVTAIVQSSDDNRLDDDGTLSADLLFTVPAGSGSWAIYIEGSSDSDANDVAAVIGEANGDAGSALDSNGNGRIQLSELHYTLPALGGDLTAGLMDVSGFLDTSELANDETTQFLNGYLTGTGNIDFPDYTLGVAWSGETAGGMGVTVVAARGRGLGEDYPSYSELFDGDIDADGDSLQNEDKGYFVGGELNWAVNETQLRVGAWTNTGDHTMVDGTAGFDNAYGLYGMAEGTMMGDTLWNVRVGWADDDTSSVETYASAAVEIPTQYAAVGIGLAHAGASDRNAALSDTTVAEVYARFDINDNIAITPSIQWIDNPNQDGSGTVHDDNLAVFSLRAQVSF